MRVTELPVRKERQQKKEFGQWNPKICKGAGYVRKHSVIV